jgi:CubicO group peptidase (beta-lactamase class C family)
MTVGAERAKAKSAMTVQDLLRHTSDLTYAMFGDLGRADDLARRQPPGG